MTPTKLRSERALKIGGIALSTFGVIGGLIGLADGDILNVLLGFADLLLGAIFVVHTKSVGRPPTYPAFHRADPAHRPPR